MNYLIFGIELVLIALLWLLVPTTLSLKIAGTLVIIALSQLTHHWLHAR